MILKKILIFIIACFSIQSVFASKNKEISLEEMVNLFNRNDFKQDLNLSAAGEVMKKKAFIISTWDKVFEAQDEKSIEESRENLKNVNLAKFPLSLRLKGIVIKGRLDLKISEKEKDLSQVKWSKKDYWSFLSLKENYSSFLKVELPKKTNKKNTSFSLWESEFKKAVRKDEWSDYQKESLLSFEPNWCRNLRSYKGKVRLFMFCRHNHEHPCLLVMKDQKGRWHKDSNGKLWSQPKLGLSRHGLPAHQVNGDTPQGIYTIDSVMPETNRQLVFGKFRRLILNFISKSRNEKDFKSLMPKSVQGLSWWQEGMVARDVGRSLLRIHGTGLINVNPASNWYPFFPTSGCIASRENRYDGQEFIDQRELLDEMMKASGLNPVFANEAKLKGLLYVVDIDSKEAPVTQAEVEQFISL